MKKYLLFVFGLYWMHATGLLAQTNPCGNGTIVYNGVSIDAVSFDASTNTGLKLPMWIKAGSTLAAGTRVNSILVIEFIESPNQTGGFNLLYNQTLEVQTTPQTVPSGRVWKVESILKLSNPFSTTVAATNNSPICRGGTLQLSAPTIQGATYAWTGPNGFSSTSQNPTISNVTAAQAGVYQVSVSLNGCSTTASTTVVVNTPPQAGFTTSPSLLYQNAPVSFTPTVSGLSYQWTFPSGSPATSNSANPSVTWSSSGTYPVKLVITDANGCKDSITTPLQVSACVPGVPSSAFTYSPTNVSTVNTVTFTPATSSQTYLWSFQGTPAFQGGTSTSSFDPQVRWSAGGTFAVSLTVTDNTGCSTTSSQNITVSSCVTGGTASFNFTGSTTSWTVPAGVCQITVEAYGAKGGNSRVSGGAGAFERGTFAVTPGTTYSIIVGGKGTDGNGGGGGGGTFMVGPGNTPLIIAGGGGGAGYDNSSFQNSLNGGNCVAAGCNGTNGSCGTFGNGGSSGNGGNGGVCTQNGTGGGGGGGLLSNGTDANGCGYSSSQGGRSFVNGGTVANGGCSIFGGFGGGGAGGCNGGGGGGGGGYSGGGGGTPWCNSGGTGGHGGGGGSFNSGTNTTSTPGGNTQDNGRLIITW